MTLIRLAIIVVVFSGCLFIGGCAKTASGKNAYDTSSGKAAFKQKSREYENTSPNVIPGTNP